MTGLRDALEAAVLRGLDYVLERQDRAGSWTDWALPPGPSSGWTTAYVGWQLAGAGAPFRDRLGSALERAAGWLADHQSPDGGWGYNPEVASDADSTSLAILLLSAVGSPAPPRAYQHLRRFQRADGGFSTFLPDGINGSWGRSHPEITPVAVQALLTDPDGTPAAVLERGIAWILEARRHDGTWNSFWWTTGLWATGASFEVLARIGRPHAVPDTLIRMDPADCLHSAILLALVAEEEWSPQADRVARRLLDAQASDGAWRGEAALRVTRRDCDRPWDRADAGPLFADPERLFTTATVARALAKAHAVLTHGRDAR